MKTVNSKKEFRRKILIIQFTDKCAMQCCHCQFSCAPSNDKMITAETLIKIINGPFYKNAKSILISGGEPTQHDDFFKMINIIIENSYQKYILILSNGLWAYNEGYIQMMKELADKENVGIQITNDPRFYKYNIRKVEHNSIKYEHQLRVLANLGRTKNLDEEGRKGVPFRNSPNCYNFRSIYKRQNMSLVEAMMFLEMQGKLCNIFYSPLGEISPSECGRWIIGTVDDDIDTLEAKAKETIVPCNECGHYSTLPDFYKFF